MLEESRGLEDEPEATCGVFAISGKTQHDCCGNDPGGHAQVRNPLVHAFTDDMKPRQMTPILMVVQDSLSGEHLKHAMNGAIQHLEKLQGSAG